MIEILQCKRIRSMRIYRERPWLELCTQFLVVYSIQITANAIDFPIDYDCPSTITGFRSFVLFIIHALQQRQLLMVNTTIVTKDTKKSSNKNIFLANLARSQCNSWYLMIPKNIDAIFKNYLQLKSKWKLKHFCFFSWRLVHARERQCALWLIIDRGIALFCQWGSILLTFLLRFSSPKHGSSQSANASRSQFAVKCHTIKFILFG